ncbi:outer membrane beta-barrel protein [Fibrobacter sp.]|uniref:outer membrane beta-barrel protein n=1 Tax=Fibrobacter sp. TaxID=35828 RepID=UPI003890A252
MKLRNLKFAVSVLFALSMFAYADEFDDFDSDNSAVSSEESGSASESGSYSGSTDSEFADDEEYAAAYARYKAENTSKAEIDRKRTEGFARAIQLGVRAQAGTNTFFGSGSDGWSLGFQGGGGIMVKMPLGLKNLSIAPELTFNYRYYSYEMDTDFGTNEANIDVMLFEIPLIIRYTFEDYNFFLGAGLNLGLKLSGTSEYNQNMNEGTDITRENTIATSGVEVGGVFDIGFIATRYINIDVRVMQSFSSLLNKTLVAETVFMDSSLLTFYVMAGITYLF